MSTKPWFCSRLMGGLGNQMFQYAIVRSLSHDNDSAFALDTSYLESSFPGVTHRTYDLDAYSIAGSLASRGDLLEILPAGAKGLARRISDRILPLQKRRFVHEPSQRFHPEVLKVRAPAYLAGYWQSPEYFSRNASLIRADFTLRSPLSVAAEKYLLSIRAGVSVSIHVRRGDYIRNRRNLSYHGVAAPTYYRMALERIHAEVGGVSVFVFSDEPEWVRANLDLGQSMTVVDFAGSRSAHEEIQLMSSCQHHVISNSTFGWWGAWLGASDRKLVVAPSQWYVDPAREIDILPSDWIRI